MQTDPNGLLLCKKKHTAMGMGEENLLNPPTNPENCFSYTVQYLQYWASFPMGFHMFFSEVTARPQTPTVGRTVLKFGDGRCSNLHFSAETNLCFLPSLLFSKEADHWNLLTYNSIVWHSLIMQGKFLISLLVSQPPFQNTDMLRKFRRKEQQQLIHFLMLQ